MPEKKEKKGKSPNQAETVQPDIRVQTLNQDESPGSGAQRINIKEAKSSTNGSDDALFSLKNINPFLLIILNNNNLHQIISEDIDDCA